MRVADRGKLFSHGAPAFVALLAFAVLSSPTISLAASAGPQPATTGVPAIAAEPAEGVCTQCHNSFALNPDAAGVITLEGVPATYEPGHSYTLTLKIAHSDKAAIRWGFQMTAVAMKDGAGAGQFIATDAAKTQVIEAMSGTRSYIEHSYGGTAIGQTGGASWSFDWKAPASAIGKVGFFAAANASERGRIESGRSHLLALARADRSVVGKLNRHSRDEKTGTVPVFRSRPRPAASRASSRATKTGTVPVFGGHARAAATFASLPMRHTTSGRSARASGLREPMSAAVSRTMSRKS